MAFLFNLNFAIATFLVTLVSICMEKTRTRRFVALVIAPTFFFCFFYDFFYSVLNGPWPIMMIYISALAFVLLYLFCISLKKIPEFDEKKSLAIIFLFFFAQFLIVLIRQTIPWAIDTFPLSNVEAVLFTLFAAENGGAEGFVLESFYSKVLYNSIGIFVVFVSAQIIGATILCRRRIFAESCLWKLRIQIGGKHFRSCLSGLQKSALLIFFLFCSPLVVILPIIVTSTPFKVFFQQPTDSQLYREHYVFPDSIQIDAVTSPRNLVVIFMESMQNAFADYTPEINELGKRADLFAPGGIDVFGTNWTIAAITGKLCGIPLNIPLSSNEYLGNLPTYLPKAHCLMDVLKENGYRQLFMQGSSGNFTQKRKFWTAHGGVDVHDIEYYRRIGEIPMDYNVFWGFEVRKLYRLAKKELDSLSRGDTPFAAYILTVDTHLPYGYLDDSCKSNFAEVKGKIPKVLRCASKQLGDFLMWAQDQKWFENTVIAIMGDHTMPSLATKLNWPKQDSLYWVSFILNSSISTPVSRRNYSSLDMFPTLLEAMGFAIDGRAVALGRSLYSSKPTLLELYGKDVLDSLLRERSYQYDYFLMGRE